MADWIYPLLPWVPIALLIVVWIPMKAAGKTPHFQRTDELGGSALVGKNAKEMMYWAMQPAGRILLTLRITANGVTWSSGMFGLGAGIALANGRMGLGSLLAFLSFLADGLDGMVARLNGTGSLAGEVLDAAMDRYVEFFWFIGVAVWYRGDTPRLVLTLAALAGAMMVSYTSAKAESMQTEVPSGAMRRIERAVVVSCGGSFTAFAKPFEGFWQDHGIAADWPMLLALGLIAVLGNYSTFTRSRALMRAVAHRK